MNPLWKCCGMAERGFSRPGADLCQDRFVAPASAQSDQTLPVGSRPSFGKA